MISTIKESGFCHGIRKAVATADKYAETIKQGQKVYLYGDLANNSHLMDKYINNGFILTHNLSEIEPNSTVIIRAHGIPKSVYATLEAKNVHIEDCTCTHIKPIHKIVEAESAKGKTMLIVGKKDHPEVIGIRGWCKNNNAIVLETEVDFENTNWTTPICVVGQTTSKPEWWHKATDLILKKQPNAQIHNTLCNVTILKSEKAAQLASGLDIMVVIGDRKSANSVELFETCAQVCPKTFFVSSLQELIAAKLPLQLNIKIGMVGSASAPPEIINSIYDYLTFAEFLIEAKHEIENFSHKTEPNKTAFVNEATEDLYAHNRDGKRIRGALIKLGEKITSDNNNNFLTVAAAYELFQTAILIHDDIIDRSETRRGKTTIHTASYNAQLDNGLPTNEAIHYGISRAICIGDYGLFKANSLLAQAEISNHIKVRIFQQFSHIQLRTIEGEIADVLLPYKQINPVEDDAAYIEVVDQIYNDKTAWYTIAGPLMLGAICGNATEELENQLKDIGLPLGIAFQIKDDLLGMYANDETQGKPAISDMLEKKQTLIYGYAYKHASPQERQQLDQLYGKQNATQQDLETVREIFTNTGAKQFSEDEINKLSQLSLNLIEKSNLNDESKTLLRGLVHFLVVRKY